MALTNTADNRQFRSSVAAVVLTVIFLISGRILFWKKPASNPEPSASVSETEGTTTEPNHITMPEMTTTTTTTSAAIITPEQTYLSGDTTDSFTTKSSTATTASETLSEPADSTPAADSSYFADALFIGDSRTVGMANYAPLEGAEYFATVGLSTHTVNEKLSEVGNRKNVTLPQLLAAQKFGKIYLMLGINELGNNRTLTLQNYKELVEEIRQAQPDAILVIQANLHVAESRSSTDPVINNDQINSFNDAIAQFADNDHIFYLDVNPVFDDENGALGAEYTHDGTHPLAKYYRKWDEFLIANPIIP